MNEYIDLNIVSENDVVILGGKYTVAATSIMNRRRLGLYTADVLVIGEHGLKRGRLCPSHPRLDVPPGFIQHGVYLGKKFLGRHSDKESWRDAPEGALRRIRDAIMTTQRAVEGIDAEIHILGVKKETNVRKTLTFSHSGTLRYHYAVYYSGFLHGVYRDKGAWGRSPEWDSSRAWVGSEVLEFTLRISDHPPVAWRQDGRKEISCDTTNSWGNTQEEAVVACREEMLVQASAAQAAFTEKAEKNFASGLNLAAYEKGRQAATVVEYAEARSLSVTTGKEVPADTFYWDSYPESRKKVKAARENAVDAFMKVAPKPIIFFGD